MNPSVLIRAKMLKTVKQTSNFTLCATRASKIQYTYGTERMAI